VTGPDLDPGEIDAIGHESAVAGINDRPSGPSALPRIC
jgi:hypothetical protein